MQICLLAEPSNAAHHPARAEHSEKPFKMRVAGSGACAKLAGAPLLWDLNSGSSVIQ